MNIIAIIEAADAVWTFFWDEFCDWYLERKNQEPDWAYAFRVYDEALKLLHPLMPFVTEELWHRRGNQGSISVERYPQFDPSLGAPEIERHMKLQQDIITATRVQRAAHKIDRKTKLTGRLTASQAVDGPWIAASTNTEFKFEASTEPGFSIHIDFPEDAAATEEQHARLRKENEQLEKVIANSKRQLDNQEIVRKNARESGGDAAREAGRI